MNRYQPCCFFEKGWSNISYCVSLGLVLLFLSEVFWRDMFALTLTCDSNASPESNSVSLTPKQKWHH